MARRFIYIVCPYGKEEWLVDFYPPNGKEEWLVDLYLLCVPNGNEEWLVDLYLLCPLMEKKSGS